MCEFVVMFSDVVMFGTELFSMLCACGSVMCASMSVRIRFDRYRSVTRKKIQSKRQTPA